MTDASNDADPRPSAEELMAFADGELGGRRAAEVADWVAGHPDAAAEVEEQQRLRMLWEQTAPSEPSRLAWDRTLSGMESALTARRPASAWRRFRPLWLSGVVAASLAVVMLGRSLLVQPVPPRPAAADEEPFPVAQASEIDIISMDAHDADSLVGHPPVLADLKFVAAGDLGQVRVDPHPDGWGARLEPGAVPMVVALPAQKERQP
jgi:anti-sigma factor RsiW